MGQHSFNSSAYRAAKKRARQKKAAQMDTAVRMLTDFMDDAPDVNVPSSLQDTANAAIEVVDVAKQSERCKMDCLIIAERTLAIMAIAVEIGSTAEVVKNTELRESINQLGRDIQEILIIIKNIAFHGFLRFGDKQRISKCHEILERNRAAFQQYYTITDDFGVRLAEQRAIRFTKGEKIAPSTSTPAQSRTIEDSEATYRRSPPEPLDLTGDVTRTTTYPVAYGGYADIWPGNLHMPSGTYRVAVKVLRSRTINDAEQNKINKRFRREVRVWQRLEHGNVLPLFGLTSDFAPHGNAMVCPWLANGNLNDYLGRSAGGLCATACFQILRDIAAGLSYLHSRKIVHGDLTGPNVLIGNKGKAYLCDFGLSTIIADISGSSYFTSTIAGAIRWAAAELYRYEEDYTPTLTFYCDIYSFGSVMLQVLTGKPPYHYLATTMQVLHERLREGRHPRRPAGSLVRDDDWAFLERCWSDDRSGRRPSMVEVLDHVNSRLIRA